MSASAVDPILLEAMREVDALTPACPPIAPQVATIDNTCNAKIGKHACGKLAGHKDDYHQARNGTLWLTDTAYHYDWRTRKETVVPRYTQDTGPRPPGAEINPAAQEFALPDGSSVLISRVERDGWKAVLEEIALRA